MMMTCLECSYCLETKDGDDKYCSAPVPAWCNTCYNDAVPFMKENDPKMAKDCPFFSREPRRLLELGMEDARNQELGALKHRVGLLEDQMRELVEKFKSRGKR